MTQSTPNTVERKSSSPALPPRLDALLEASATGDKTAFGELYEATSSILSRRIHRVVRDASQAEEVCQEVFLVIWQTAFRFDQTHGHALAWMMAIAHHKAVDRVRYAQATSIRDSRYQATNPGFLHDSTAEAALRTLEAERVRQALEELSGVQRRALKLAFLESHTHTEIAAILGLPLGTAKSRIRAGLINLRSQLITP